MSTAPDGWADGPIGFIGLGNMGGPMSANVAGAGYDLVAYDAAGTSERAPAGATIAEGAADVAAAARTVLLSLPDGSAVSRVAAAIAAAPARKARVVVDLSTIGVDAAEKTAAALAEADIAYLDAPVSGGVSGATAGTLALMAAGDRTLFERLQGPLSRFAKNRFYVGERPGQGQAMKVLNNYLSATATAASSEALIFGETQGLDIATMLDVLNASSGRNRATADKFPRILLEGEERIGFTTALMRKDLHLFLDRARGEGLPLTMGDALGTLWDEVTETAPGSDVGQFYGLMRNRAGSRADST